MILLANGWHYAPAFFVGDRVHFPGALPERYVGQVLTVRLFSLKVSNLLYFLLTTILIR
jgi:hypothetical protein